MNLSFKKAREWAEAVIDGDGGLKRFYQIAGILSDDFDIDFTSKEDDVYAISWSFKVNHKRLTLHYSIYNGISIFPTKKNDARKNENNAALELASLLKYRLMSLPQC